MQKFNPVKTLNNRTFKQNKGRNIVAIIAIIMTTLMFTTLFVLSQSMSRNFVEMAFRQTGSNSHVSFKSITEEQAAKIAGHPDVKEVGNSIVLGLAVNTKLSGRQVELRWADDSYAVHSFAKPSEGGMPQSADEIALDTLVLDRLGIPHELGQTVTLEWNKDITSDEITASTFTLCGYWESNESMYASMAWVSRTFADKMTDGLQAPKQAQILGTHMAQVTLYNDHSLEASMGRILADTALEDLEYNVNLAYSPELNANAAQESLPMYLGMILVFLAGYLIIYNIFQISVTADIQFYGKLKTLGATTKQIKKLIFGQANRLCLIAIPLGIAAGYILGMVLVPILLGMAEGSASVSANPVIFIGSALFSWLTVIISCLRPARLAGKVSPIEALRYSDVTAASGKRNGKRNAAGSHGNSAGSGSQSRNRTKTSIAAMAWRNLGRNKKRTFIVICSLTLGLVLLCCFYAKNSSFDMDKYLASLTIADFDLSDATHEDFLRGYDPHGTTLNNDLLARVNALEGLTATGSLYTHELPMELNQQLLRNLNSFYTPDRLNEWASYDSNGAQALQDAVAAQQATATLYGLDGIPLDSLTQNENILDGSFDAQEFSTGRYVLAVSPNISLEELSPDVMLPTSSVGDTITLDGAPYTVMAIVASSSPITGGAPEIDSSKEFELGYILPADTFRALYPENTLRKYFYNVKDENLAAAQEMLDDYIQQVDSSLPVASRQTKAEQYEAETRSSSVMGNAISIIIALVGVLNFINSMVTAIVSRKREFAMIQSVGMTKRQLNAMLTREGLYYAVITLVVSYIVSSLAVGIGVRAMVEGGYSTFHFTLLPLLICTPLLLAFALLVPFFCFKNLEKKSIVERLRME